MSTVKVSTAVSATPKSGTGGVEYDKVALFPPLDSWVDERLEGLRQASESDIVKTIRNLTGEERLESVKAGSLAVAFGAVPEAITAWLDPDRLTPRWEFQLDMLAFDMLLFGLVYRYAVREGDDNPMQRMGVLAAFVLPRALFMVQMSPECTSPPLSCGQPLGYFSWSMLAQVLKQLVIGGLSLGGALYGLERAFGVGAVRRFRGNPASNIPQADSEEEGFRWPW